MVRKATENKLPKGVEYHGGKIRIWFMWNKKRWREPYPYPPTKANIAAAGRLRADVVSLIKMDALDARKYFELFPDTTQLEVHEQVVLFSEAAQAYLDHVQVSPATREEYRKVLQARWMPALKERDIRAINLAELRAIIKAESWPSPKTHNNALTPLRGVFEMAYDNDHIEMNPAIKLKNLKTQKLRADPFTADEVKTILSYMHEEFSGFDRIYTYYFELAFNTGMRTSELLALTWDDIDFRSNYAVISKAKVRGKVRNSTKTMHDREVWLNENAMKALLELQQLTGTHPSRMLFLAPQTMEPIKSYKAPLKVWRKTLNKLKIRYRRAYNTRHTYASLALMNNVPIGLIAKQLGHSVITLTTTYAKWMTSSADKELLNTLNIPSPLSDTRELTTTSL